VKIGMGTVWRVSAPGGGQAANPIPTKGSYQGGRHRGRFGG
jgi:hypothetical protein